METTQPFGLSNDGKSSFESLPKLPNSHNYDAAQSENSDFALGKPEKLLAELEGNPNLEHSEILVESNNNLLNISTASEPEPQALPAVLINEPTDEPDEIEEAVLSPDHVLFINDSL